MSGSVAEECIHLMNRLKRLSDGIDLILSVLEPNAAQQTNHERAMLVENLVAMESSNYRMFPQLGERVSPKSPWTTQSLVQAPQKYIDRVGVSM